jgi:hypothetical protein
MEFEDGGGVAKIAPVTLEALDLEVAELVECLLKLTGEALAVEAECRKRRDGRGGGLGAREDVGFEKRDAVEAPRGVGEFVD